MDFSAIPTFIWVVLPVAVVLMIAAIVFRARLHARQARRMVGALSSGPSDTVITTAGVPATGELATRLALGAMLAVGLGEPWNTLRLPTSLRTVSIETIANPDAWGITDSDGLRMAGRMLDEEFGDDAVQAVLELRVHLAAEVGASVSGEQWLAALDQVHTSAGAPHSLLAERRTAAQRVIAYEAKMAADQILPAPVQSPLAYDYGRAVNLARWGVVCGYIDEPEAERIVHRAGELAFARYHSWPEYAAAYLLGRVIAFDADQGQWYADTLRVLESDPASPWRVNPWPGTAPA